MKFAGCKKLVWRKIPIVEERLQVLAKSQRRFPYAPPDTADDPMTTAKSLAKAMEDPQSQHDATVFLDLAFGMVQSHTVKVRVLLESALILVKSIYASTGSMASLQFRTAIF